MDHPTEFERAVLDKLLAGEHPVLAALRLQAATVLVDNREFSGVGFFCTFRVSVNVPQGALEADFHFGDVIAEFEGLEFGAGFVLFVRDGHIAMLEGYTFGEPWPESVTEFKLSYSKAQRDLSVLDSAGPARTG